MRKMISLDTGEYRFLSEKFEFMTPEDIENMPRYIVTVRKNNMKKIIAAVIENELTAVQKVFVDERYYKNMKVSDIAKLHGISRQSVYRTLAAANERLCLALKYVYCCGFSLVAPPKDFEEMLNEINKENEYD